MKFRNMTLSKDYHDDGILFAHILERDFRLERNRFGSAQFRIEVEHHGTCQTKLCKDIDEAREFLADAIELLSEAHRLFPPLTAEERARYAAEQNH